MKTMFLALILVVCCLGCWNRVSIDKGEAFGPAVPISGMPGCVTQKVYVQSGGTNTEVGVVVVRCEGLTSVSTSRPVNKTRQNEVTIHPSECPICPGETKP
jgi:hypothetical protein